MQVKEYGRNIYLTEYEEAVERALQVLHRDLGKVGTFDCTDCDFCPFAVHNHPTGVVCQIENLRNEIKIFLGCLGEVEEDDIQLNW